MGMGHSVRHVLAALAFAGVLAFFCVLLVQAQVIQGEEYYETSLRSKAKVERVPAARGKILDRNGKVLVRDEVRWTAVVAEGAPEESRVRSAEAVTVTPSSPGRISRSAICAPSLRPRRGNFFSLLFYTNPPKRTRGNSAPPPLPNREFFPKFSLFHWKREENYAIL